MKDPKAAIPTMLLGIVVSFLILWFVLSNLWILIPACLIYAVYLYSVRKKKGDDKACDDYIDVEARDYSRTEMFSDACEHFAPPTNGDKIRQMTNSQLSKFLARLAVCNVCFPDSPKGDRKYWYDWTFAPAESEGEDE